MRLVQSDKNALAQVFDILATTLTRTALVATFTAVKPHRLTSGQFVTIVGAIPLAFNRQKVAVTVTGATTFTYPIEMDPGADATVTNVVANRCLDANDYNPFAQVRKETGRLLVESLGCPVGEFGFDVINDTNNRTDRAYGILLPISDCVVTTLTSTGTISGTFATLTLKAGVAYPIPIITQIQLASGALLAYRWRPIE